jgi:hypothetical protein
MTNLLLVLLLLLLDAGVVAARTSPPPPTTGGAFYPRGRDRPHNYEILSEEVRYSGWRIVVRRSVGLVASDNASVDVVHAVDVDRRTSTRELTRVIEYDVVDQAHAGGAVVIFAWNTTSKTATIVREYMPGPHRVLGGLAAGIVENGKHDVPSGLPEGGGEEDDGRGGGESPESSTLVAARFELEEEWRVFIFRPPLV